MIKQGRSRINGSGLLFTCFATRAIHIEALEELDTDSFINALVRFINQRGKPDHNTSDCGTNFKVAV